MFTRHVIVACVKIIVFWGVCLLLTKNYKNGVFDDFEKLISGFLVKISKSIIWPHFWPKFGQGCGQIIDFEIFTCFFFLNVLFFKFHSLILVFYTQFFQAFISFFTEVGRIVRY